MKNSIKWLLAVGFVLLAASVLLRTYGQIHKDPDQDEDEAEEAVKARSRVAVVNGQTVITLDAAAQQRMGMAVAGLRAVDARRDESAAATVLATQALVTLRENYVAAEAALAKDVAQLAVSAREYQRLQKLYAENQNTSQKALEEAKSVMETNRADVEAARKELRIARAAVEQGWGGAVAGWVADDSPSLGSVLDHKMMLVQLTLPPQSPFEEPPKIRLSTYSGRAVEASYVSPFPQVDPRIQGISMLYLARGDPLLEPGMNLIARLPVGKRLRGVLIPQSAVVWWQGEAWVYEETSPARFTRIEVPTDMPLNGGYFAAAGFLPGERLVARGAQFLLSEEFRSEIQPED